MSAAHAAKTIIVTGASRSGARDPRIYAGLRDVNAASTRCGMPPYLAPNFAIRAGEDAPAVGHAAELVRFGIDSVINVPGSFTSARTSTRLMT